MARIVFSGTESMSSSVTTTYLPLLHSKPRTVSDREITSSWNGQYTFIWMRFRQEACRRLKPIPPCSVARYSLTGMVTSPNWTAPRHIDRAMRPPLPVLSAPPRGALRRASAGVTISRDCKHLGTLGRVRRYHADAPMDAPPGEGDPQWT